MIDRSKAPAYKAPGKFILFQPESTELDNSVPIHVFNVGNLPLLKIEFVYTAGKWFEQKSGASFFCAKMITEGSRKFSSRQIADIFDLYGVHYEINPGPDYTSLAFYTINRHLEHILPIINDILFNATFPQKELESFKNIQLQQLKINQEKNNFLASRRFKEQLFGQDHPYGKNLDEQKIMGIQKEDLITNYQNNFGHAFEIILAGQIDHNTISSINKFFGQQGKFKRIEFPEIKPVGIYKSQYQVKQESLQSSIKIGKRLFKKDHQDFIPLLLVNELFGGYFGSRLMQNIREDKGFTYSINSNLVPLKNDGYFVISTDAKKEFRSKTIYEIEKELEILANEDVKISELERVKNYLKGSFLSGITTPFALADKFKSIHFYDLDYRYFDTLFDVIDNVSAEQIKILTQKYLDINTMIQVSVG